MAEAPTKKPTMFNEIGGTGLNIYTGYSLQEDFQRELQGANGVRIYTEMGTTPIVGAILFVLEQMIAQVEWKIEPATEDPSDQEPADFIKGALFEDMNVSWADNLSEICSMFRYGWHWAEVCYKMRRGKTDSITQPSSKFDDGLIGWRKWAPRGQNTLYGWDIDESGGIRAMIQMLPNEPSRGQISIPIEKSLLFRTKLDRNSPEGISILRSAYAPWFYGKRMQEIEAIGVERDLAGLPTLTPPEGLDLWNRNDPEAVANKRLAEQMVRSIRRGEREGVLIPFGWKLELLASGSRRNFDVSTIINRYDTRVAQSCLADFIFLGSGKTGSWALSSDKTDMFVLALGAYLKRIKETINRHAIPTLLDVNGMDYEDPPRLDHGDIETQDLTELATYLTALNTIGAISFPDLDMEKHLRNVADLPQMSEEQQQAEQDMPTQPKPNGQAGPVMTKRVAWKKMNELREMMKAQKNGAQE